MPKEPEDYNHVPLASYRRSYVSKEAHEKAIAAKDAEIARLRKEVDGLTETVKHDLKLIAPLRAKCAKMRELLGELPRLLVQARSYVKAHQTDIAKGIKQRNDLHDRLGAMFDRIDAILESEDTDDT